MGVPKGASKTCYDSVGWCHGWVIEVTGKVSGDSALAVGSARIFSSRDSYNVASRGDFVVLEVQFHCFWRDQYTSCLALLNIKGDIKVCRISMRAMRNAQSQNATMAYGCC